MDIIKYIVKTLIHKPLKNIFTGPSNHYKMCNQTPTCPQMRGQVLKPHDIGRTSDRDCDKTKTTILVHELEIKDFLIEELQKKLVETTQQNKNQLQKWKRLYHLREIQDLHKTLPKSEKMAPTTATIKEETTTAPASIIILPDKITEENTKTDTVHQHNIAAESKPKLQQEILDNNHYIPQKLPTSSTPLYPEQPTLEIQRYLLFSLTKFIIWRVLETIAIRATNTPYKSTNKSRVTDEDRPNQGNKSKTSLPTIQTCQPLQEKENTMKINSLQAETQVTDIKEPAQNCLVLPDK